MEERARTTPVNAETGVLVAGSGPGGLADIREVQRRIERRGVRIG